MRELPGGLVVSTLRFHCRGPLVDPGLGNKDPTSHAVQLQKQNKTQME